MVADNREPSPSDSAEPSAQPDEPRLRISHLMALTVCVAVYLQFRIFTLKVLFGVDPASLPAGFSTIFLTLEGIGQGAALAGFVLWAGRRWRGLRFPRHPGEYLLMVLAATVTLDLLERVSPAIVSRYPSLQSGVVAMGIGVLGLRGLVFVWPVLAVENRRWRKFFVILLGVKILGFCATVFLSLLMHPGPRASGWHFVHSLQSVRAASELVIAAVLLLAALRDHSQGNRYPWTHWLGVGTQLWLIGVALMLCLAIVFLQS